MIQSRASACLVFLGTVHVASASLRIVHIKSHTSALYGNAQCPCVGLDNVKGELAVKIDDKKTMFPAEAGGSCAAWDSASHPECEQGTDKNFTRDGKQPSWCKQSWCYVDPCKCNIPVIPKVSSYLPDATYQGKPVYYSYATCGSVDTWTSAKHKTACVNQKTESTCGKLEKCGWDGQRCVGKELLGACSQKVDEKKFGKEACKCVGIDNVEGNLAATVDGGRKVSFPADYGSSCNAWEADVHPDCKGDKAPKWCKKAWCWVDPCSCGWYSGRPRVSAGWLGKDVSFQGKQLYYSYTTCGEKDQFTEDYNPEACVNQKTEAACTSQGDKCYWSKPGKMCMGNEIAQTCRGKQPPQYSSACSFTPLALMAFVTALWM